MIRVDIKRTQFFSELSEDLQEKYFDCKRSQFLPNIDTFYYTICLNADGLESSICDKLIEDLEKGKEQLKEQGTDIPITDNLVLTTKRFNMYGYCLTCADKYDIFICDYLPNDTTPRILVQLRSFLLWQKSTRKAIEETFVEVKKLLDKYNLVVKQIKENRIDYCFHTNSIQSPIKFFSDSILNHHMLTTFDIYTKLGRIKKNELTLEYFALGSRKSNNVFTRVYNKTREVIEQGYKSFFFQLWRSKNMISFYDEYCYKYAFTEKSFNALDKARLLFYLDYGSDEWHKQEIKLLLKDKNITHTQIEELADALMPKVTLIVNIEFQTKRKFYYTCDEFIDILKCWECEHIELKRLYKIIDNQRPFVDCLTTDILCFIKDKDFRPEEEETLKCKRNTQDWWWRLKTVKLEQFEENYLSRDYSTRLDKEKIAKRLVKTIASSALYFEKDTNTDFVEDLTDLLGSLNDNDMKNISKFSLQDDGIFAKEDELFNTKFFEDYNEYKEKKFRTIKNRLAKKQDDITDTVSPTL